ncbi:Spx/MgsR family RNA polymerase-binding regulatory protein [Cyanobium sp. ATX 6A2]|uniref:Spx/MgsR family RNA polymerase-binding regulatory protein n=1 Tax=Cyanobium sp. ATX 6A2 TaxID=2823700 RepID=UPI0020CC1AC1|nr:Spx/MgsR family RNA polymerase-binding regulatory protein [Cyanobium sp. ATX 6A2]MCP9887735.1 Spx/MgsR family RNA polymerase-binding regulatory protein [Cyanobium sp. ATX 6A2]
MKLYSYSRCSTCRKAIAWLQAHHLAVDPIDITLQPPSREELGLALAQLGRKRLLNTSGQSYRTLGPATVQAMDDDQALAALAADGRLIRRPFLLTAEGRVLIGFRPEEWQQLLLE